MITRITKVFTFDAAHHLDNHQGACRNLHGHTYKLEVTLEGAPRGTDGTPEEGMVMDFGRLKAIVDPYIDAHLDHQLLNEHFELTTAEFLAAAIFIHIRDKLESATNFEVTVTSGRFNPIQPRLYRVRLWETPTSYAEVMAERRFQADDPFEDVAKMAWPSKQLSLFEE